MAIYPKKIIDLVRYPGFAGSSSDPSSVGRAASFSCGSVVRIELHIDRAGDSIEKIRHATNGCGYMIAAAELIARKMQGSRLTELHGAEGLSSLVWETIGEISAERTQCVDIVVQAFRDALFDHRKRTIEEFTGEQALICTCFGVTEAVISSVIDSGKVIDMSDVSAACKAGSGCGSCRMLIEEMIDASRRLRQTDMV